jgi:hypothetical protein
MRNRGSLSVALLFLGAVACGEPGGATSSSAAVSGKPAVSSSATAKVSASASSAAAPATPDADPTVVAELKKFQSCKLRDKGGFDFGCAADEGGFKAFADTYVAGSGGSDPAKVQKLGKACLAFIGDADTALRLAAVKCLKDGFSVRVDKTAVEPLLKALETEKVADIQYQEAWLVGELRVSGNDATRTVELIKKLKQTPESRSAIAPLLGALKWEPTDGAIDEAITLAGDDDFQIAGKALDLLAGVKTRGADVCKAVETVVLEKKKRSVGAADALVNIDPPCKTDLDKVVTAIAEKLADEDKDPQLERESNLVELGRFIDKAKLSAGQKAKLSKAVAERGKKKLSGEETELAALDKALKK